MKKIIFLSFMMSMSLAHAKMGSEGVGGGDLCEDRIKIVRDDIKTWIKAGGPAGLKLNGDMTEKQYSDSMLNSIGSAKVRCVGNGDEGYPVSVDGVAKVCRFDSNEQGSMITCDYNKFQAMKETAQYVLVHHEYAGLSQIEIPNGSDSDYSISNQLSAFVVNEVVKKLSIKPAELKSYELLNGASNKLGLAYGIPGQKLNFDIFRDMTSDEAIDYVYSNNVRNFLVDGFSNKIIMELDYDSVLINYDGSVIGGNHFYLETKELLIGGLANCVFNTAIIEHRKWDAQISTIALVEHCSDTPKNIIIDAEELNDEIHEQMLAFIQAKNLAVFKGGASSVDVMNSTVYKGERVNRFNFLYQIPKSVDDKSLTIEANVRLTYKNGKIKAKVLSLEQIAE